jgi:hypothetical protein
MLVRSRLAVQTLGIKGVCTIASHGIDELWVCRRTTHGRAPISSPIHAITRRGTQ